MGRSADEWYATGDTALRNGDMTAARQAFSAALKANPNHANAVYRLAEIARADGNMPYAATLLQRTLSIQPAHAGAKKLLARLATDDETSTRHDEAPCPPSGSGMVGIAHSVKRSLEPFDIRQGSAVTLSFRLKTQQAEDQQARVVAVVLRGKQIRGSVENGDWVELPANWRPGTKLRRVMNLTTCSEVVVYRATVAALATALVVAFVVVWIAAVFFIVGRELFLSNR